MYLLYSSLLAISFLISIPYWAFQMLRHGKYGSGTKTGTLALRREQCLLLPFGLRICYSALLAITASRTDRDRRNRILAQLPPSRESKRRSHHNSQCPHL